MVTHTPSQRQTSFAKALPWILIFFLLLYLPRCPGQIIGNTATCDSEGEEVNIPEISDNLCITCICKNGEIKCHRKTCPLLEGCHNIHFYKPRDSCCDICQGCTYEGKDFASGTTWIDSNDPCSAFTCQAGVITKHVTQCYVSCINPVLVEGQCCPVCQGCVVDDEKYDEGEVFPSAIDRCTICQCINGSVLCSKSACPVLNCPLASQVIPQGSCCPECEDSRRVIIPAPRACLFRKEIFRNATSRDLDPCTSCTCVNGTMQCNRNVCPVLDCEIVNHDLEQCCPSCATPFKSCRHRRKSYEHGAVWQLDQCLFCLCDNGTVRCHVKQCTDSLLECPRNTQPQLLPGKCCPQCVDVEAVCAVFGDPHYRTFDGKFYIYQGMCNYILAEDCGNQPSNFSIRVRNEPRLTSEFSWTKSVIIKTGTSHIYLLQKRRVKVNKKRVVLPFIDSSGNYRIMKENDFVTLTSNSGMRIIWDGDSYLEVAVPPEFKNKICGLCGNYNDDVRDEFTGKDGQVYYNAQLFGDTWNVGSDTCRHDQISSTRSRESPCLTSEARQRKANKQCSILHGSLFEACRLAVSVQDYYVSCLTDVCECPRGKQCSCASIMAYSRVCQRERIHVDWKTHHVCGAPKCGRGARWHACASACPLTCSNWRYLQVCNKPCEGGCQCRPGLVLDGHRCIHPSRCPATRAKKRRKRKRKTAES